MRIAVISGTGFVGTRLVYARSYDSIDSQCFQATTENLFSAAERAGVRHIDRLSLVGIVKLPDVEYHLSELDQDHVLETGSVPTSVVHAAQFMDLIEGIMSRATQRHRASAHHPYSRLPPGPRRGPGGHGHWAAPPWEARGPGTGCPLVNRLHRLARGTTGGRIRSILRGAA